MRVSKVGPLARILENKYGFDDLWIKGFAGGGIKLGKFSWKRGDAGLIDGLLVNGSAALVDRVAGLLRQVQTGPLPLCLRHDPRPYRPVGGAGQDGRRLRRQGRPMEANWPLLSVLIWLPILGGCHARLRRRPRPAGRWFALLVAVATFAVSLPLFAGDDVPSPAMHFVEDRAWIRASTSATTWAWTAFRWRWCADQLHHGAGADRRLDLGGAPRAPVHRRVPDPRGPDDRRVLRAGRAAVLRVLRGHADPDVHHHRRLGRPAARLRHAEVLPVHLPRLGVHADRADLPVPARRRARASSWPTCTRCR